MSRANLDEDICVHIFTTSAAMLGVCMTVVGVIRVVTAVRRVNTIADEMHSTNAIVYFFAGLCAYCALRSKHWRRNRVLERVADGIFLTGLVMSAVATAYIAWVMSGFSRANRVGHDVRQEGGTAFYPRCRNAVKPYPPRVR